MKLLLHSAATLAFGISASTTLLAAAPADTERFGGFFFLPEALSNNQMTDRIQEAMQDIQENPAIIPLTRTGIHRLALRARVLDPAIETTKFQHYYKGLEVIGGMVLHHRTRDGRNISNHLSLFDLNTNPALSPEDALSIARNTIGYREISKVPALKILPDPEGSSAKLVYWLDIRPEGNLPGADLVIDAHSGKLIAHLSHELDTDLRGEPGTGMNLDTSPKKIQSGPIVWPWPWTPVGSSSDQASIRIYAATSDCQKVDEDGYPTDVNVESCKLLIDDSSADTTNDADARKAYDNSRRVLDYYLHTHGRNSYDDRGSPAISLVHIGSKFNNAFWSTDLNIMAYGDGDGKTYKSFASALDVAGHEMTHGVTSQTAQLMMMGESGALNEANSDFFGKMIASDGTWTIGREIFIDPAKRGIRDLADPHSMMARYRDASGKIVTKPYPATYQELFKPAAGESCGPQNDNCYVHINSTITSHAAYLVTQAIGKEKAEKLYYLVLTQYLTSSATIRSQRNSTLEACDQLFDADTCNAVKEAYRQVGL